MSSAAGSLSGSLITMTTSSVLLMVPRARTSLGIGIHSHLVDSSGPSEGATPDGPLNCTSGGVSDLLIDLDARHVRVRWRSTNGPDASVGRSQRVLGFRSSPGTSQQGRWKARSVVNTAAGSSDVRLSR
jgi:hypothetical protein